MALIVVAAVFRPSDEHPVTAGSDATAGSSARKFFDEMAAAAARGDRTTDADHWQLRGILLWPDGTRREDEYYFDRSGQVFVLHSADSTADATAAPGPLADISGARLEPTRPVAHGPDATRRRTGRHGAQPCPGRDGTAGERADQSPAAGRPVRGAVGLPRTAAIGAERDGEGRSGVAVEVDDGGRKSSDGGRVVFTPATGLILETTYNLGAHWPAPLDEAAAAQTRMSLVRYTYLESGPIDRLPPSVMASWSPGT